MGKNKNERLTLIISNVDHDLKKHTPSYTSHVWEETLVQPFGSQIAMFRPFGPIVLLRRSSIETVTCAQ